MVYQMMEGLVRLFLSLQCLSKTFLQQTLIWYFIPKIEAVTLKIASNGLQPLVSNYIKKSTVLFIHIQLIYILGSGEPTLSVCWVPSMPRTLLAGQGTKWLRLLDMRSKCYVLFNIVSIRRFTTYQHTYTRSLLINSSRGKSQQLIWKYINLKCFNQELSFYTHCEIRKMTLYTFFCQRTKS